MIVTALIFNKKTLLYLLLTFSEALAVLGKSLQYCGVQLWYDQGGPNINAFLEAYVCCITSQFA